VEFRNSLRLGVLLVALTGVNVYVFFFRDDTSVKKLMQPSSTGTVLAEEKKRIATEGAATAKGPAQAAAPQAATPRGAGAAPAAARPLAPAAATPGTAAVPAPAAPGDGRTVEGIIGANDTLGTVLTREGFGAVAGNVLKGLSRLIDPKSIRPGDRYLLGFDAEGTPESFEYLPTPVVRYIVNAVPDGVWAGRKEEKPLTVRTEEAGGAIESSLYESVQTAGESGALVSKLVDLFAWDMNFYIDTHPGDHWKVVVEKQYLGDKFYKYGAILAAEYGGRVGTFRAFAWAPSGRAVRYYDEKGLAVAKSFLKSPLRYVRVSSGFDRNRFHPILHRNKAHLGVDYAAPTGTPVWASAGGKVVECGPKPGSGNTVAIAHGNGLMTRYYHLNKFAPGMRAGRQVQQKELIGYVGMTGLATGPHLHFAVVKGGIFVDPTRMNIAREAPVPDRAAYLAAIKPRLLALKAPAPVTKVAKNEQVGAGAQ
jgi:murein DD-endopeptidase MepM/ murein hydrolase activator NlpD